MINVERSARVTLNNLAAYEFVFVFSRDGIAKKLRGKPQRNETNKKSQSESVSGDKNESDASATGSHVSIFNCRSFVRPPTSITVF
jgi:hypothetical protein